MISRTWKGVFVVSISIALGVAGGYWLAQPRVSAVPDAASEQKPKPSVDRKVLYWYDPMYPQQKFDKPGKSPFMDMQLVPKFDSGADSNCTVRDVEAAATAEPRP